MDQDATWYGSTHKRDTAPSFRRVSIVATLAHVSYLGGEELRLHLTQRRLGRGLPPYQVAS